MESVEVRKQLVDALELDLVGPRHDSELQTEVLRESPSRRYLTGFLVPLEADEEQRAEEAAEEEIDELDDRGGSDDTDTPERRAAKRVYFPSSLGLSVLVSGDTESLEVTCRWGDYRPEDQELGDDSNESDENPEDQGDPEDGEGKARTVPVWVRRQRQESVVLALPSHTDRPTEQDVPESDGLKIITSVRPVPDSEMDGLALPTGTRTVSIFLVNKRQPAPDVTRDTGFVFQARVEITADTPLVPRPDVRGLVFDDWDERVADLQYRDAFEYAVGHGVSTWAVPDAEEQCRSVGTCWIPSAEIELVAPATIADVELSMEALSELVDGDDARNRLGQFVTQYRDWIDGQRAETTGEPESRKEISEELMRRATAVADRIDAGIDLLSDPEALDAFRIANRVMAVSSRQRFGVLADQDPASLDPPRWRPFQLAFILMNLPGIADPTHGDRQTVDLLFFPTGGGKTEAYLGLSAFTLVLRRLRNPGLSSAGVTVLMRYTLRLLTLDQLGRAATLICALELERQDNVEKFGEWPFEIGLWVGRAATPNRMGAKGDNDPYSARRKTIAFLNDDRKPSPIPLEECPWCGTKFKRSSFHLLPNTDNPTDLRVVCSNRKCQFTRDRALPIVAVDEPLYRRVPCFLIATVDKFAAMPWTGQVGGLFGHLDRSDSNGFYGSCDDAGAGRPLDGGSLLPPELIIQDELHLISGPMGTMVGLYETAIDELSSREVEGQVIRPKIIASTATVRRAENQIQALFNRRQVEVFPPPGPNRRNSFFAETRTRDESNARLYLGIAAQGRSAKVVLLRTYLALLAAGQRAYRDNGGRRNKTNPVDPYMTLLGYFNSLRELGGSRRIVEDEVRTRLLAYGARKRFGEKQGIFSDRKINYDVYELTSRVSTNKVAEAKRLLTLPFHEDKRVDVALATNMISVGLDITRLGLMVVLGQPRTNAEYIQATSRVGRDEQKPGLVITLLNIHRPRDRSHYERFAAYHESFYRHVEATSVTPFSDRALDRGLAGTVIALARHGISSLTPPAGAAEVSQERTRLSFVADALAERAVGHKKHSSQQDADDLRNRVRLRVDDLLDTWEGIANELHNQGSGLQYQREIGAAQRLLHDFLDPDLLALPQKYQKFRANRSMRDVEPSVNLWLKTLDNLDIEEDDE